MKTKVTDRELLAKSNILCAVCEWDSFYETFSLSKMG